MAGIKNTIHKAKGKHSTYETHYCRHCNTYTACTKANGHNKKCKYPPEYACGECAGSILNGIFQFGKKTAVCKPECGREKNGTFSHGQDCPHRWGVPDDFFTKKEKVDAASVGVFGRKLGREECP